MSQNWVSRLPEKAWQSQCSSTYARYTEHLHGQLAQQTLLKLRLCLAETQLRRPRLLLYGITCLNQYQSTSKQCQHLAVAVVGSKANEPTSEDGKRVNQTKLPTQYLYLRQHQIQSRSTQSSRIRYSLLVTGHSPVALMHATIQAKQPTAVHNNQRNYNYSIYPVNATIDTCNSHIPRTTDAAMRCY